MSLFLSDLTPDIAVFFDPALASDGEQEPVGKTASVESTAWDTHAWHPNHPLKPRSAVHDSSLSDISSSDESTSRPTFRPSHKRSLSQGSASSDTTTLWETASPPSSRKGVERSPTENDRGVQSSTSDHPPFSEDFELSTKEYINWLISSTDQEDECDEEDEPPWTTLNKAQGSFHADTMASGLGRGANGRLLSSACTTSPSQPAFDLLEGKEGEAAMTELQELLDFKLFEQSPQWPSTVEKGKGGGEGGAVVATATTVAPQAQSSFSAQPCASLQSCYPFQHGRFDLTQSMLLWSFPPPNMAARTTLGMEEAAPPQPHFTLMDPHDREGSPAKKPKRKPSKRPTLPSSASSSTSSLFSSASSSAVESLSGTLLGSNGSGHFVQHADGSAAAAIAAAAAALATTTASPLTRSIPNPGYHPTNTNHAHTPIFQPHIAHHYLHQLSLGGQPHTPQSGAGGGSVPAVHPLTRRATVDETSSSSLSSSSSSLSSLALSSSASTKPFVHPGFYSLSSQVKNAARLEAMASLSSCGGDPTAMVAAPRPTPSPLPQGDESTTAPFWAPGQPSPRTMSAGSNSFTSAALSLTPTTQHSPANSSGSVGENGGSNNSSSNGNGLTPSGTVVRKRKSLDQGASGGTSMPITPPSALSSSPTSCSSSSSSSQSDELMGQGARLSPGSASSASSSSSAAAAAFETATAAAAASNARALGGVPHGQPFVAAFPVQSPEHLQVMRMLQLGCGEQVRGGYKEGGSGGGKGMGSGQASASTSVCMSGPMRSGSGSEGRKKGRASPGMGALHQQQQEQHQHQHPSPGQDPRGPMGRRYSHELMSGILPTAHVPVSVPICSPTPTAAAMNSIRQLHQQLEQGLGLCHNGASTPAMHGGGISVIGGVGLPPPLVTPENGGLPTGATATAATAPRHAAAAAPPTHAAFHHYPQAGIPPPLMSSRPPSYPPPGYLESETGYFLPPPARRPGSPLHPHTPPGGGRGAVGGGGGGGGGSVGGGGGAAAGSPLPSSGGMMPPPGMTTRKPNPAEVPPSALPADFFVLEEAVLARRRASASEVYRRNL
ncbi:hypothetical protein DFQ26_003635 [Actinomortierella ambigua]|nr:hypothetical protein DFQ26_003635 [Actinomortierella ambigua]